MPPQPGDRSTTFRDHSLKVKVFICLYTIRGLKLRRFLFRPFGAHEMGQHIDRKGENDCRVLLRADVVQSLEKN